MKKIIITALLVLVMAVPAMASDLITLPNPATYSQATFKDLSKDLGFAISYFPLSPAQSLAGNLIPFGFDAGLEVTAVQLDTKKPQWQLMKDAGATVPSYLPIPKLHVQAGFKLPFVPLIPPIDLGVVYSMVPGTKITLLGGEVKIGLLEDGIIMPAVALRGSFTKLGGLDKTIDMSTQQLDISVSKKFLLLTPYIGYGVLQIKSTPKDPVATTNVTVGPVTYKGLTEEKFTEGKLFAGLKLSLGLINFVFEYDKATVAAYSFRANVSF